MKALARLVRRFARGVPAATPILWPAIIIVGRDDIIILKLDRRLPTADRERIEAAWNRVTNAVPLIVLEAGIDISVLHCRRETP